MVVDKFSVESTMRPNADMRQVMTQVQSGMPINQMHSMHGVPPTTQVVVNSSAHYPMSHTNGATMMPQSGMPPHIAHQAQPQQLHPIQQHMTPQAQNEDVVVFQQQDQVPQPTQQPAQAAPVNTALEMQKVQLQLQELSMRRQEIESQKTRDTIKHVIINAAAFVFFFPIMIFTAPYSIISSAKSSSQHNKQLRAIQEQVSSCQQRLLELQHQ